MNVRIEKDTVECLNLVVVDEHLVEISIGWLGTLELLPLGVDNNLAATFEVHDDVGANGSTGPKGCRDLTIDTNSELCRVTTEFVEDVKLPYLVHIKERAEGVLNP
jgi:hypothetical protein